MLLCFNFFPFGTWNFKKCLDFCIKYAFFASFCCCACCPCAVYFFPFFCSLDAFFFHVGRERINCKTIQFIQKCFFALAQRYRWQQNCHTTSKKERNRTYLTALMALLYMHFLFSFVFFFFFTFHFVLYYLYFCCCYCCMFVFHFYLSENCKRNLEKSSRWNAWITFSLFYTIQMQSQCNSG